LQKWALLSVVKTTTRGLPCVKRGLPCVKPNFYYT
jgi:hypothetical protein